VTRLGDNGNFGAKPKSFDHPTAETRHRNTPRKFAMKSTASPIQWAPLDREDLLLLFEPGEASPKTVATLLV
jgi:hypothetical protein